MTQQPDEAAQDERFVSIEELIAAYGDPVDRMTISERVRRTGRHRASTFRLRLPGARGKLNA